MQNESQSSIKWKHSNFEETIHPPKFRRNHIEKTSINNGGNQSRLYVLLHILLQYYLQPHTFECRQIEYDCFRAHVTAKRKLFNFIYCIHIAEKLSLFLLLSLVIISVYKYHVHNFVSITSLNKCKPNILFILFQINCQYIKINYSFLLLV